MHARGVVQTRRIAVYVAMVIAAGIIHLLAVVTTRTGVGIVVNVLVVRTSGRVVSGAVGASAGRVAVCAVGACAGSVASAVVAGGAIGIGAIGIGAVCAGAVGIGGVAAAVCVASHCEERFGFRSFSARSSFFLVCLLL